MTFDEAFAEIELAPGASADAIRRAYLRKLKTRSPETDPEGFRRLREAFERLSGTPETPDVPAPATGPRETAEAPEQALPDPLDDIRQILDLHAQDLPAEAVQAQERLAQHLRTAGRETEILNAHTAALWQIAQEISRLPPGFPPTVRTSIARAVHDGTLETALPSVQSVVQEDPDAGWRMASDLKELPALRSLYHGAVLAALPAWKAHEPVISQSRRPVARDPREIRRAMVIVIAAAAVLGVLYFLFAPPPLAEPLSRSLEAAVQAICRHGAEGPTPAEEDLCRKSRNLAVLVEQRRCATSVLYAMLEAHQKVKAQTSRAADGSAMKADAAVSDLHGEYAELCFRPRRGASF